MNQEIIALLKTALECSVLIDPLNPGLTAPKLIEVEKRVGYQDGEINDAICYVGMVHFGEGKLRPAPPRDHVMELL